MRRIDSSPRATIPGVAQVQAPQVGAARRRGTAVVICALLCVLAVSANPVWGDGPVASSVSALADGGELITLHSATWGELFPGNDGAPASTWALALDVTDHDGESRRVLVPSTADPRHETMPTLVPGDGSTHLFWRSVRADGRYELRFATLGGDASAPEISTMARVSNAAGEAVLFERAPLMAVTRDAFHLDGDGQHGDGTSGEALTGRYTLVHLLWRGSGESSGLGYTTLIFVDGVYAGWHRLFELGGMLAAPQQDGEGDEENGPGGVLAPALLDLLDLRVAGDGRSLVVTYANAAENRLGTFEISALPMVLSVLGDGIRDEIYAAADLYDPENLGAFVEKVKGSVIAIGHRARVHPAVREYLADRLGRWLGETAADYGLSGFVELGEDARALAIDLSSAVFASTIEDPSAPGATIVEIDLGGLVGEGPAPLQLLDLHELVNLPAPTGLDDATDVFVVASSDGERLAVAWRSAAPEDGFLNFVESQADATWSGVRRLPLASAVTLAEARDLLASRLR